MYIKYAEFILVLDSPLGLDASAGVNNNNNNYYYYYYYFEDIYAHK